ncbi:hypothetical protein ABWR82_004311 [Salmonella enterica subsp. enterica]|nr:hypothetical protein [Salmonella enterica]
MATAKTKGAVIADMNQAGEPLEGALTGEVVRATLDHEAGLVHELLVQRYREFGTELFEERANELVDCVRRIFARLAVPLEDLNASPADTTLRDFINDASEQVIQSMQAGA